MLVNWAKLALFVGGQGIDSQEKEGLMLLVCLSFCPIVEILEGLGMLENSSQKFTPRVQVFHQTHFTVSSSSGNIQ